MLVHYYDADHRSKVREHRAMVELSCTPKEARHTYRRERKYGHCRSDVARLIVLGCWGVPLIRRDTPT